MSLCVNVMQEKIPVEEVFEQLKCTKEGLTAEEGLKRLQVFGPNKLEEKKESKVLKFLGFMWNPLSWVMELAAIMAIAMANGGVCSTRSIHNLLQIKLTVYFKIHSTFKSEQGKPTDWPDFVGIVVLLLINSTISFIEENNAGNAAAALMASLAPKTKVRIYIHVHQACLTSLMCTCAGIRTKLNLKCRC